MPDKSGDPGVKTPEPINAQSEKPMLQMEEKSQFFVFGASAPGSPDLSGMYYPSVVELKPLMFFSAM